ncbi:ComEC/Rec2 family competence protein [Nocardioides sp. HM23]|uniref:ComEC/Rec2 family competence protein n=1 Tax=Nocardioides bizhenqiangii TaxID=3095076 RepID=UPI002AC9F71C|nr:ComEC/Rec2 family competence protein [Nocardioides sp. HM23]MDZ5623209.1 ComEC/Rec2 family competence protein [Nocardioides sp. HM23]
MEEQTATDPGGPPPHDLRMASVGAAGWLGGIAAYGVGAHAVWWPVVLGVLAVVVTRLSRRRVARLLAACAVVAAGVVAGALLRTEAVSHGPLRQLAEQRAVAELTGVVVSDPVEVDGQWGSQVVVRLRVHEATARGETYRLGARVVVIGDPAWSGAALGSEVRVVGRLAPADEGDLDALVVGARPPVRIRGPDVWWRGAAAVRSSIRDSVASRPEPQRELVPALVVGDDAGIPVGLEQDFRTTGLTHLTAVSGTNLTLVVGFLLLLARSLRVRGRWLTVVGLLGIVGFVLLARTEPSVVRAAAMGTVGLFALGTDGRRRGLRALGVAVTGLLLVTPALAVSAGFALSVLATGGIVVLGPPAQRALGQWLPAPVAGAVAVPFAAQLACTPVIAALSGEVSLVAVLANLLVAPVVGPATVLGLAGGLAALVWDPLGRVAGTAAGTCVGWIIRVAEWGADLPAPSVRWGSGALALAVLAGLCVVVGFAAPALLRRRGLGVALIVGSLVVVLGVPGRIASLPGGWPHGWPPRGWLLAVCDVGQGDALAVSVGPQTAIVVDAGPDPEPVDRCLDRLGVAAVPLLVLTHFHADHVGGLEGVLRGRSVAAVEASPMLDPPAAVESVERAARERGIPVTLAQYGATRQYGDVTLQVLWPDLPTPVAGPGDGSAANDASVVLLVESHGVRMLLTGDVEPLGQARLAARLPDLDLDVLKVPHHGSSYQDTDWLRALDAEIAVVSVGEGNDYGHPDPRLLDALADGGAVVARTDQDGDVAVVPGDEGPAVVADD